MGAGAEPVEVEEGAGGKEEEKAAVSCSICLDAVVAAGGERSTARLQCGHEFHLGKRPRFDLLMRYSYGIVPLCCCDARFRGWADMETIFRGNFAELRSFQACSDFLSR